MKNKFFYYCSPLIYPVMPESAGTTVIKLDFAAIIINHVPENIEGLEDAEINVEVGVFYEGEIKSSKKFKIDIKDQKLTPRYFEEKYVLPGYGYVQVSLFADKPYFSKINTEKGYALLVGKKAIISTILPQSKYSDLLIIDNMKTTGTFNLVNPGHYIDSKSNIANSALLINPYDGPVVADAISDNGKKIRKKIPGKSAVIINLAKIVPEKNPTCVLYSGSNRYTGWDIRHSYDDVNKITNIDHLEYFRAIPTYTEKNFFQSVKYIGKKIARNFNRF